MKIEYRKQFFAADYTLSVDIDGESKGLEKAAREGQDAVSKLGQSSRQTAEDMKNALSGVTGSVGSLSPAAGQMASSVSSSMDSVKQSVDNMSTGVDGAKSSADHLSDSFDQAGDASEDFGKSGTKAVTDIETLLASAGILAGLDKVKDGFLECAAAAETFEASIAQVATIAGVEHMDQMASDILDLSNASGQATDALALTAYSAISAGSAVEDAVDDARTATELATAGFTDSASALQVLKTAANSYGDEQSDLQHISDSLIETQNLGVTTIAELSQNMGVAIATASAYNVSLENLEAAYIATTKSGINTANSTTYISRMVSELGDANSTTAKIIEKKTGKSFGTLMKEGNSLADVLEILYDSCDGNAEAFMNLWQQASAGKAANAIVSQGLGNFRKNLDKVTNSAGATSKAYSIMEDTTKHAHDRMANSVKNLGAVIGGELNPTLERVYDSVADLAEGLQKFVQDNPGVVTAVAGLVAGLVTATGALAVASAAVTIFTATLAVNPVIAMVAALAGVTAAFAVFAGAARAATEEAAESISPVAQEVEDLTEQIEKSNDRVRGSIDDIGKSFDDNTAAAEGNANMAKKLAKRLEELSDKADKTAGEQAEMEDIAGQLADMYPGLNGLIDEHTGKLTKSADAIEDYVDNAKDMAMAQAYFDAATDSYKAAAEATTAAEDAQKKLNDAEREHKDLSRERSELQKLSNAETANGAAQMVNYHGQLMSVHDAIVINAEALEQNETAQAGLNAALTESNDLAAEATAQGDLAMEQHTALTQSTAEWAAAQEEANAQQSASIEVQDQAAAAWQNLSAQQQQTAADFANNVTSLIDSTQQAIDSQMNMFEQFQQGAEISTETLLDNMQSQIDGVTQWEQNMAELADRGINQDLLQHLAEMGPQGSNYVQAFVNMSDDEFARANEMWGQSMDMKAMTDEWGQNLIESGTENIQRSMGGLADLMESSGADTALGLARGIESVAGQVEGTADEFGINVIEAANEALGVHSPSWKMEAAGQNFDQGLANGILYGMGWVTAAARQVAWAAVEAAKAELGINSPSTVARDLLGHNYGKGLVLGIEDMYGDIETAAAGAADMMTGNIPSSGILSGFRGRATSQAGAYAGAYGGNTTNLGGVTMIVNAQPGQDVSQLADLVADRILERARV